VGTTIPTPVGRACIELTASPWRAIHRHQIPFVS
jgi:hypothetical protein